MIIIFLFGAVLAMLLSALLVLVYFEISLRIRQSIGCYTLEGTLAGLGIGLVFSLLFNFSTNHPWFASGGALIAFIVFFLAPAAVSGFVVGRVYEKSKKSIFE